MAGAHVAPPKQDNGNTDGQQVMTFCMLYRAASWKPGEVQAGALKNVGALGNHRSRKRRQLAIVRARNPVASDTRGNAPVHGILWLPPLLHTQAQVKSMARKQSLPRCRPTRCVSALARSLCHSLLCCLEKLRVWHPARNVSRKRGNYWRS